MALIHSDSIQIRSADPLVDLELCESMLLHLQVNTKFSLSILLVYRPPGPQINFINNLMEYLTTVLTSGNAQLLLEDLNR